jgi:hypothetical protein
MSQAIVFYPLKIEFWKHINIFQCLFATAQVFSSGYCGLLPFPGSLCFSCKPRAPWAYSSPVRPSANPALAGPRHRWTSTHSLKPKRAASPYFVVDFHLPDHTGFAGAFATSRTTSPLTLANCFRSAAAMTTSSLGNYVPSPIRLMATTLWCDFLLKAALL